jgi:hypothetical protein
MDAFRFFTALLPDCESQRLAFQAEPCFPVGSFCIIVLAWLQAEQMFSFLRIELFELTVY